MGTGGSQSNDGRAFWSAAKLPSGQRQNAVPYGMQQQPDTSGVLYVTDGMESGRLAGDAQMRGTVAGRYGYQVWPAVPGGVDAKHAWH